MNFGFINHLCKRKILSFLNRRLLRSLHKLLDSKIQCLKCEMDWATFLVNSFCYDIEILYTFEKIEKKNKNFI